jgi:hypothetical protein
MPNKIEGLEPIVFYSGADGRIMVGNSLTSFEKGIWTHDVVAGASFAGIPTGAVPLRQGAKGWIAHEGGPGKDEAGIAGLPLAQEFGVPAAAIATKEARLSGGITLMTGHVSRCNEAAAALGVKPGQTGEEAAHLRIHPKGMICNDGGGLDNSGAEGLAILDEHGILGATVSSESARIGDALSAYHDGIISAVNQSAAAKEVQVGVPAREAAERMLG